MARFELWVWSHGHRRMHACSNTALKRSHTEFLFLCVFGWLAGWVGRWVGLFCVSFLDLLLRKSRCTVLAWLRPCYVAQVGLQWSSFLCLLSAGISGVHHKALLFHFLFQNQHSLSHVRTHHLTHSLWWVALMTLLNCRRIQKERNPL